ncbi:Cof-type HAD-IIB family hydrolase [Tetragenococcus muriaticus]|uniref:Haloacid dehalogenase-like family hydrolase n=1 Tax=Tetragenococcus muriaticus 3MR10-3 TaxID=1302648 RepID=A0A091C0U5_9ENTE|nr:Cof-type HAD-IIB family hydrolase [Tetragenococcus muriaticus]KFN91441.1 haloacid dehalogenase-like family hydrolase [Tetragenococcus muriaticus 3MR10-3]
MIKLIASDMDGTLLDTNMHIPEKNVAAIKYAQAQGIEFMVATGRNRLEALPSLTEAGIKCAMITLNGAQVFDEEGNSIFMESIELETAEKVLDLLEKEDIYCEISTNKGTFSQSKERRIENFATMVAEAMPHLTHKVAIAMSTARLEYLPIHFVDSIREVMRRKDIIVLKIICFHRDGSAFLGPAARMVNENFTNLFVTSSGQNNLEINHHLAQKGIAVAHIAKDRGINLDEVMTIGDNLNDVSMIQAADVSFAMGNGLPEVKEYAKYTTDTNIAAGVGQAIYRAIKENL